MSDQSIVGERDFIIDILPSGEAILPRDDEFSLLIAAALKDEAAVLFCEQSKNNAVLIGKRMCG